ncbi:hypothetical protein [Roseivirga pacifica]|uniref:hypothetical protein n=1 Tax=Roseivirga pacifica TaxID=1267423 RepID=UPI003BB18C53
MIKELFEYIENITGMSKDAAAPMLIAIGIFLLGEIFKYGGRSIREWKVRKNYRKIFKELILSVAADTQSQGSGFKDFTDSLTLDNQGNFSLKQVTVGHLKTFLEIPFSQFYGAYFEGIGPKEIELKYLNDTYKHMRSLADIENSINDIKSNFQNKYSQYESKWDNDTTYLAAMLEEVLTNRDYIISFREHIVELDRIYSRYQNRENRFNANVIVNFLVDPIHNFLSNQPTMPFTLALLRLCNNVTHNRDNLNAFFEANKSEFMVYHSIYSEAYRHFSKIN